MPHLSPQQISLAFLITGVLSIVLHKPLARLDVLLIKGGPFRMEQDRLRHAGDIIIAVGVGLLVLAVVLVRVR